MVLLLKRELDSLPECLRWWWSGWPPFTGDHVGYPRFQDLGNFSPRRKIFGSKNLHIFWRQIFAVESNLTVFIYIYKGVRQIVTIFWPGKPYWRRRISIVDLLVLTSLNQLLFVLKIWNTFFTKQATLMRRSTVLSLSLSIPWFWQYIFSAQYIYYFSQNCTKYVIDWEILITPLFYYVKDNPLKIRCKCICIYIPSLTSTHTHTHAHSHTVFISLHRDKTRVQMSAKIFPHLKVKC